MWKQILIVCDEWLELQYFIQILLQQWLKHADIAQLSHEIYGVIVQHINAQNEW